jgi:hypothetical protein
MVAEIGLIYSKCRTGYYLYGVLNNKTISFINLSHSLELGGSPALLAVF